MSTAMAVVAPNPSPKKNPPNFKLLEDEADLSNKSSPAGASTVSATSAWNDHRLMFPQSSKLSDSAEIAPLMAPKNLNKQVAVPNLKKPKLGHAAPKRDTEVRKSSIDALMAKLSKQQSEYEERKGVKAGKAEQSTATPDVTPSVSASARTSSASESVEDTPVIKKNPMLKIEPPTDLEVIRLQKELELANATIGRQERELTEARTVKKHVGPQNNGYINGMQDSFIAQNPRQQHWNQADDARSDVSDAFSAGSGGGYRYQNVGGYGQPVPSSRIWGQAPQRPFTNRSMAPPSLAPVVIPSAHRHFAGQPSPMSADSFGPNMGGFGRHRGRGGMNPTSANSFAPLPSDDGTPMSLLSVNHQLQPQMGNFQAPLTTYQPRPIGAPLSATAAEFNAGTVIGPWESRASSPGQVILPTTEPLNYRRLLDKSVSCNWKYIVDKIVHNNDQQASIFLQQKLKVGTAEQKFEIVESIVAQAYPLMVNRFGNFLVQRCFEHGTPEQVVAIAGAIRGNTLTLSMDPFGCHVVQKAFDAVPEEYKAVMVHELLRRIPETVIHRYACHVWQKLFELRWSDSPPQIMKYVNEALRTLWHEVALGETGSLVVQNIFENCLEEDKRPCIEEVLNSIDVIAHGQFGNWCIQHICEHGAPADRNRAIDHVLLYATEYSMDQFASKVVEKCLKIGGSDFLDRYLARVCEGQSDRPRIPLIDIASDQYGNYLVQYILTHANSQHRELVASHIRKHMVSLRGSKFGSRVSMLCSNPAYATRPGPGIGAQTQRYIAATPFNAQSPAMSGASCTPVQAYATNGQINNGNRVFSGSFN